MTLSKTCLACCTLALTLVTTAPSRAGDGVEEELAALVESVNRLVDSMVRHETGNSDERGMRQVGLAVQLLDIRTRQQEAIQQELRRLADTEQRIYGWIAANETRIETVERQIAESVDEAKRLELEAKREMTKVNMSNNQKRLEHLAQKRVDLENRLIERERSTRRVEGIVDEWLEDLGSATGN